MKHIEKRIVSWSPENPNSVERAFRKGFLLGARCACLMPTYEAFDLIYDLCDLQMYDLNEIFQTDNWDDTSSAFGRGFGRAVTQVTDWIDQNGSRERLEEWMTVVRNWAREVPLSKERSAALPPTISNWSWNEVVRHWNNSQPNRRDYE